MSSAKADILQAVRSALGPAGPATGEVPRTYRPAGSVPADAELFCARVAEYRASVHRVSATDLNDALRRLSRGRTAVPGGSQFPGIEDRNLDAIDLVGFDTAITGCALAIADTGTIVLDGGARSGRRVLSLVPDHHVCVVLSTDIVGSVTDAIGRLDPRLPLTFISGPSATSDIELERVEGVHGPRSLDVVVVR